MPGFNYTAPIITADEERAEFEAFSEEERLRLEADIYGTAVANTDEVEESPELLERSIQMMHEALEHIADKEEYVEALQRAPDLVAKESPAILFLRCENWNAWAAASRLARYWKFRRLLFGERAYLCMTLTGAMAEDAEYLKKAIVFEIEPDAHGRPIVFCDRTRMEAAVAPREAVARCIFYNVHRLALSKQYQSKGYILLINMQGYDIYYHYDRILTKRMINMARLLPIRFLAAHFCAGTRRSAIDIFIPIVKHMSGREFRHRLLFHAGTDIEVLHQVEKFGLTLNHLKVIHDGLVKRLCRASAWIEQQGKQEDGFERRCTSDFNSRKQVCVAALYDKSRKHPPVEESNMMRSGFTTTETKSRSAM